MITFVMGPMMTEARRLAREAIRQRLKERGQKVHELSFKQITVAAEAYLKEHSDIIDLACAKLSSAEQNQKAHKSGLSLVQMSGSKWRSK